MVQRLLWGVFFLEEVRRDYGAFLTRGIYRRFLLAYVFMRGPPVQNNSMPPGRGWVVGLEGQGVILRPCQCSAGV